MKASTQLDNLKLARPDLFGLPPALGEDRLTQEIKRVEELLSTLKRVRRSYSMRNRLSSDQKIAALAKATPETVYVDAYILTAEEQAAADADDLIEFMAQRESREQTTDN
jgi:ABC-type uncharacterized transport system ATPase subunit